MRSRDSHDRKKNTQSGERSNERERDKERDVYMGRYGEKVRGV